MLAAVAERGTTRALASLLLPCAPGQSAEITAEHPTEVPELRQEAPWLA